MIAILFVVALFILFVSVFLLNNKTKANISDEEIKEALPEKCLNCSNKTCLKNENQDCEKE